MIAPVPDFRLGRPAARVAYLFSRVALAECDMGACTLLPRLIGQGRASELLFTGRGMTADEGLACGFFDRPVSSDTLEPQAAQLAQSLADGPTFARSMTEAMLNQEWSMTIEQAIEAEAQAQASCMQARDFERAYRAFVDKRMPRFEGN